MSRSRLERQLSDLSDRIRRAREDLRVAEEQFAHFNEATDDARIRSLVSETPLADQEHREAKKHSDAMDRHRDELVAAIGRLEAEQDQLLDRYLAEQG